jgi:hypothetical protein
MSDLKCRACGSSNITDAKEACAECGHGWHLDRCAAYCPECAAGGIKDTKGVQSQKLDLMKWVLLLDEPDLYGTDSRDYAMNVPGGVVLRHVGAPIAGQPMLFLPRVRVKGTQLVAFEFLESA